MSNIIDLPKIDGNNELLKVISLDGGHLLNQFEIIKESINFIKIHPL